MEQVINSKMKLTGWTEARLFDKDGNEKKLFNANGLWKLVKKYFGLDLKIPFLLGNWQYGGIKMNTITTKGKEVTAKQLNGVTTAPVTAIALGIGTGGTTALNSEITTGGGARGAATCTNTTTDATGDTAQLVKTFTFTSSFAITEEGLLDNNTSGGNLVAYQTFSAINVVDTDTLQITHKVKVA